MLLMLLTMQHDGVRYLNQENVFEIKKKLIGESNNSNVFSHELLQ